MKLKKRLTRYGSGMDFKIFCILLKKPLFKKMKTVSLFLETSAASSYDRTASTATWNLQNPILIPSDVKTCSLRVISSDIWNLVSNVSATLGNKIDIQLGGAGPVYTLTIPEGQYSVAALNAAVENQLVTQGLVATNLVITGDAPTQRVAFTSDVAATIISFPAADYLWNVLGFAQGDALTLTLAGVRYLAPEIAKFNNINTFLIHSDLIDAGIPANGDYYGIIAKVPITSPSGSLITFQPSYPIAVDASNLIGARVQSVSVWLTNETGWQRVDTRENFSVLVELSYN